MFIEDIITLLAGHARSNLFDQKIVLSFRDQIFAGRGFTEKQANLALKIITRQKTLIESILHCSIDDVIINPSFKLPRRVLSENKSITVSDNSVFGKVFKVQFPYNEEIVELIRKQRDTITYAQWDKDEKSWIFAANERSLKFLIEILDKYEFVADEKFMSYVGQYNIIFNNAENYIPTLTHSDNTFYIKNIKKELSSIDEDSVLPAIFKARKLGVQIWDETISALLLNESLNATVTEFIDSSPGTKFEIDLAERSTFDIVPIIKNLSPTIIIIPGGSELEKLNEGLEVLTCAGIVPAEISVMFRLPSETGSVFNNQVKDLKINNPLSNKTKAVFISGKLPKTVIDSGIKFHSIINFNFYGIHYSLRELISTHHNVINIAHKKNIRTINFGLL